jgi:hypothetical protein
MSHDDDELPEGLRWITFVDGSMDGHKRLLRDSPEWFVPGSTYEIILTGEQYVYDGERFVLDRGATS